MSRNILQTIVGALIVSTIVGYMLWSLKGKSLRRAKADFRVEAPVIFNEFSRDEAAATKKYLNKIVVITGTVSASQTGGQGDSVVMLASNDLIFGVRCNMELFSQHSHRRFIRGETVMVKGLCKGFRKDVLMERCVEE